MPAASPILFPASSAGLVALGGSGLLVGIGVRETAGAAAAFDVLDGTTSGGNVIVPYTLAANQSVREWFAPWGIDFTNGLFVNITAGTVRGALYVIPTELADLPGADIEYQVGPSATPIRSLGYPVEPR